MIDFGRGLGEGEADVAVGAGLIGGDLRDSGDDVTGGETSTGFLASLASKLRSPKSPKLGMRCGESGFFCWPMVGGGVRCRLSPSSRSSISDPDSETVSGWLASGMADGNTTKGDVRPIDGRLNPFDQSNRFACDL